jgi:hypothetical protein
MTPYILDERGVLAFFAREFASYRMSGFPLIGSIFIGGFPLKKHPTPSRPALDPLAQLLL